MHKIAIVLAAGSTIFDIPGPNGVLVDEAAIVFEVEENDGIDPYDEVAHGLIAGGRADLLPQLTHNATVKRTDKENGQESEVEVSVAYLPTGARVERSAEEVAESEASIAENEALGEDPRVDPLASAPVVDPLAARDPFANTEEVAVDREPTVGSAELVGSDVAREPTLNSDEAPIEVNQELFPDSASAQAAFEADGTKDESSPERPRADGSYGYLEVESHPVVAEIKTLGPDASPNVAATLAGELQLENLSRDDLNDVARIAYGLDPSVYENRELLIGVIRNAQLEFAEKGSAE